MSMSQIKKARTYLAILYSTFFAVSLFKLEYSLIFAFIFYYFYKMSHKFVCPGINIKINYLKRVCCPLDEVLILQSISSKLFSLRNSLANLK